MLIHWEQGPTAHCDEFIVPEWSRVTHHDLSQTIPKPRLRWRGEGNETVNHKKRGWGFCAFGSFFSTGKVWKSGRFGVENTNQQSLQRIASRMKLCHRTFQNIGSQNVNERDRQTDKTRQASQPASQPARQTDRNTDTHTHRNTHAHTHSWLEKHILTIWGVLVAEWTRKKSSSFCNLLSGGCRVLPFSDLQGDDERSDLYFRFKSAESHVRDQCRRLRARVAKVLTLLGVFFGSMSPWLADCFLWCAPVGSEPCICRLTAGGCPNGTDHLRSLLYLPPNGAMVALLAFPSPLHGLCLGFCWSRVHLLRECRCRRGSEISFRPKRALSHWRLGLRLASSLCNVRSGPHLARRNSRISRCADGPRTQHGWPLVKVFGCFCEVFLWTLVWLGLFWTEHTT